MDEPPPEGQMEPWDPEVYAEVRRLASALMAGERGAHTLEATGLVHEAWLRLRGSRNAADLDRGAFVGLAAQAMRRILTDHARRRRSGKRSAEGGRTTLSGRAAPTTLPDFALDLDASLQELEAIDPDLARIALLRFYGGLEVREVAEATGLSERTVKRRWRFARAWLQHHMTEDEA